MAGVKAVHVVAPAGTEIQWEGWEDRRRGGHHRRDGARCRAPIKVEYEVLPHLVKEDDLSKAGARAKQGGEKVVGDPDKAFKEAEVGVRRASTASR